MTQIPNLNHEEELRNKVTLNIGMIPLCYYLIQLLPESVNILAVSVTLSGIKTIFNLALYAFVISLLIVASYFTNFVKSYKTKKFLIELFHKTYDLTIWAVVSLLLLFVLLGYLPSILSVLIKGTELAILIQIITLVIFVIILLILNKHFGGEENE